MTAQIGRFVIRDLNPWDGAALFAMTGDPAVTRYMGFRTHAEEIQAATLIHTYRHSLTKWQFICPAGNPADVLGVVGFEVRGHQVTMSIMVRGDKAARGVGREFGAPFAAWIMMHPQVWRLWSYVHVDNIAGQRVTERTGATKEGRLRRFGVFPNVSAEPQDVFVYAIVRG